MFKVRKFARIEVVFGYILELEYNLAVILQISGHKLGYIIKI